MSRHVSSRSGAVSPTKGVVFVCHRYSSDPIANAGRIRTACRSLVHVDRVPIAPQLFPPQFLDEATERDLVLELCLALVRLSGEVRVYGVPSEGMRLEIAEAHRLGIPIVAGDREAEMARAGEVSQ